MWQQLIDDMERVLADLDAAGFGLAAVHATTALDFLRFEIKLREKAEGDPRKGSDN